MATRTDAENSNPGFVRISSLKLRHLALDWAVAKAKGMEAANASDLAEFKRFGFHPSSNRDTGGALIEEYGIGTVKIAKTDRDGQGFSRHWVAKPGDTWEAVIGLYSLGYQSDVGFSPAAEGEQIFTAEGATPLEAGLRCFVASELGPVVDVPAAINFSQEDRDDLVASALKPVLELLFSTADPSAPDIQPDPDNSPSADVHRP